MTREGFIQKYVHKYGSIIYKIWEKKCSFLCNYNNAFMK